MEGDGHIGSPCSDVEHLARMTVGEKTNSLATPTFVDAKGEKVVEQVVAWRNAIEHALNLCALVVCSAIWFNL